MPDPDNKRPVEEKEPDIKVVDRRWWVQAGQPAQEGADTGAEQPRFETRKPTYVEELERQLAEKDKLLQDTISRYKDATREFDAVRARLRRDVVKDIERGKGAILAELLEVVDNLDRAIEAARQASEQGRLLEGVEMVRNQFLAKLDGLGLKRMSPLGKTFDPGRHRILTGMDNAPTFAFARRLAERHIPVWVRFVLVPGYSDDPGEVSGVAAFAGSLGNVERVDVLPFHQMGRFKWAALGLDYRLNDVAPPTPESVERACQAFRAAGLTAY